MQEERDEGDNDDDGDGKSIAVISITWQSGDDGICSVQVIF